MFFSSVREEKKSVIGLLWKRKSKHHMVTMFFRLDVCFLSSYILQSSFKGLHLYNFLMMTNLFDIFFLQISPENDMALCLVYYMAVRYIKVPYLLLIIHGIGVPNWLVLDTLHS